MMSFKIKSADSFRFQYSEQLQGIESQNSSYEKSKGNPNNIHHN